MGFRFHRSIKLLPGIRLNFGKRGISTSIGVRGAHVTYGPTGVRTTVGLPGSGLSYTHLEKSSRRISASASASPAPAALSRPDAPQGSAGLGLVWLGLIVAAVVIAMGRLTTDAPTAPLAAPMPARAENQSSARASAEAAEKTRSSEVETAALGLAQLRRAVANSDTLKLSRVVVMSQGTICYRVHLNNSRGIPYVRNAVMTGTVLNISGSEGFTGLWDNRCGNQSDGRDITSAVRHLGRR